MAIVWPPSLPQTPLIDGYEEVAAVLVKRTQTDAGPPKMGRRFTANVAQMTCRFVLSREEVDILDTFHFDHAGDAWEFTHPRRRVTVRVRFVQPPRYVNGGHPETVWYASLNLEVLPPGMPV